MKKFVRLLALALLAAPLAARAAPPEAAPVAALDDALIAMMKQGSAGASFQARAAALGPVIAQTYDMNMILQNSVGFFWSTLPAAQQQELGQEFNQFTIDSYVREFGNYAGESFTILPEERTIPGKKIIETQLSPGDGTAPVRLDYVVAQGPNGWRITDVLLDGTISQVAVHASDFSASVTSGDASPLIAALKAKISMLAGGTAPAGQP